MCVYQKNFRMLHIIIFDFIKLVYDFGKIYFAKYFNIRKHCLFIRNSNQSCLILFLFSLIPCIDIQRLCWEYSFVLILISVLQFLFMVSCLLLWICFCITGNLMWYISHWLADPIVIVIFYFISSNILWFDVLSLYSLMKGFKHNI